MKLNQACKVSMKVTSNQGTYERPNNDGKAPGGGSGDSEFVGP